MLVKASRWLVAIVSVVIFIAVLLQNWGTNTANKQVDEGNAAVEAANRFTTQGSPKYSELFADANIEGFPGNREKLKELAQETAGLFDQSAAQFRVAAAKFEEATKNSVDSTVKEYWLLKVQIYQKSAEVKTAVGKIAALFADDSVENLDQFNEKARPHTETIEKQTAEIDALVAKADKLQADHKDKFR